MKKAIYSVSFLLAAAPFVAALVRAAQPGHDLLMLWMALASFVGATVVMTFTMAGSRTLNMLLVVAAGAFVVSTMAAGTTALLLGATAAPGIGAVAFVFGLFATVSRALHRASRPRTI